jgi:cytochrome c peroxidase
MHEGSLATLAAVIDHYGKRGTADAQHTKTPGRAEV